MGPELGRAGGADIAGVEAMAVPNLRDVGGLPVRGGGHVRRALLYRSGALDRLPPADVAALVERLGLRAIFDLREARHARPPQGLPASTSYVWLDVMADATVATAAWLERLVLDPQTARAELGGPGGVELGERRFRELVTLPSARVGLARILRDVASPSSRPALVHCSTGKDRTGWAVAVLLKLLGVPDERVLEDYLRSAPLVAHIMGPYRDAFVAGGGDLEHFELLMGVRARHLEVALEEMRRGYGSVERYAEEGLGLDAGVVEALRAAFVEPSPEPSP